MKRLWPYLLLNVVVSAATMLIVLLIWNASHRTPVYTGANGFGTTLVPTFTIAPTATLPSLKTQLFTVKGVFGGGDLENEYISVAYLGSEPIDLAGWQMLQGSKVIFTFPAFQLYKDGAISLYTRSGTNSAIDLYIGLTKPIWVSGQVMRLKDPRGNERLKYVIP